ncbi:MAG: hypothetical protein DRP06_02690 [Candidatus Aenigmatarchaeota archaeon]|nr:MAG: hypothetical protein DRP06_02690 [Candidatus Aenigmarchaeota archaeon]
MLKEKRRGLRNLDIIEKDILVERIKKLSVFEAHRFYVKEVRNLILLAKSKIGVEIIKHRKKLIYRVQFHPEIKMEENQGIQIPTNFLNLRKTM